MSEKPSDCHLVNQEYRAVLHEKGVTGLFHANTVTTSLSFLTHGGLLSRASMEMRGFAQTTQWSDDEDKVLGIYDDIFFDTVDICWQCNGRNHYGPVLFCYSLDLLDNIDVPIRVTRRNPMESGNHWTVETTEDERYFQNAAELRKTFERGNFKCEVTFPSKHAVLPFRNLDYIRVDIPDVHEDLCAEAFKKIEAGAKPHGIKVFQRDRFPHDDDGAFLKSYRSLDDKTFFKMFSSDSSTGY